ncbi:MAG: PH domain-containing protein [Patescibacteria group bacterium]|jgi:hypothetical protein
MMNLQHLPNARPNEKVELFLRRHWITPLEIITYTFFLYAVPLAGILYYADSWETWTTKPYWGPIIILVACSYALLSWLFCFLEFTDYYLDIWIVTNERIINIEQKGLFTRVASEMHLSAIEDTTSEVKGMMRTFLDYGDVHIQTAGERTRFIFKGIPHPERVKEAVVKLVHGDKLRHSHEEAKMTAAEIK